MPDLSARDNQRKLHDYLARMDSYGLALNIDMNDFLRYLSDRENKRAHGTDARRKDLYNSLSREAADKKEPESNGIRGEREA